MSEDSAKGDSSAKMRIFLPLLCVLCATPVHSIFDGTCPRKDPPPGALVLSPGSKLVLTCSGHVTVDGVKVRNGSNTSRRGSSSSATPSTANIVRNTGASTISDNHVVENAVSERHHLNLTVTGENRSLETGYTASPTAPMSKSSSVGRPLKAGVMDGESDYEKEEEEGEEGKGVTTGIKSRPQWKWNGRTVEKEDRDWGDIMFEGGGATLSLSSVRLEDSGRYSCYYRGKERFVLKVIVADPPENPSLSCYKKSPIGKIRCEWTPQRPITIRPNCYLLVSKSLELTFLHIKCSYSPRASRCWCALENDGEELRTLHKAYLCVTSIGGNATSSLLTFTPMSILKPDPPANVSVQKEEGLETRMTVNWAEPTSWNSQNSFYKLIYEIQYRPVRSSYFQRQIQTETGRSYSISDAIPGVEYLIQVKAKDEYDGQWSDWSEPVFGSSWQTAPASNDITPTMVDIESSGSDGCVTDVTPTLTAVSPKPSEVLPHILWISFALLSLCLVILAVYIFRHTNRFMSKLQGLSVVTHCGSSPQSPPSVPTPPEGQALVTFGPPHYREPPPSEVEEKEEENEEQCVNEKTEAMHFNNTSYFLLQQS